MPPNANPPPGPDLPVIPSQYSFLSSNEFWLTALVLAFGLAVLLIQQWSLRGQTRLTGDEIIRAYAVTLLVIGALVFVTAGFSDKEIAPALGLFGTIAGYLLGRSSKSEG